MVKITKELISDLFERFVPCGDAEDVCCYLKDLLESDKNDDKIL